LNLRIFSFDGSLVRREENLTTAKRGHGEEEILRVLRKAESGNTVVERLV